MAAREAAGEREGEVATVEGAATAVEGAATAEVETVVGVVEAIHVQDRERVAHSRLYRSNIAERHHRCIS